MKNIFLHGLLTGIILMLQPLFFFGLDPGKKIRQYTHETWDHQQDLPQTMIYDVLQSRDSYLWIATEEGLIRYDGVRFDLFNSTNVKELVSNVIYALCESGDGKLWIGTNRGGLTSFDPKNGKFKTFTKKDGLSDLNVWSLCEGPQEGLWIGTENGLNFLKDDKITVYTTADGLSHNRARVLFQDRRGDLWMATENGLNQRDRRSGTITTYTTKDGLLSDMIWSVHGDHFGNIWIGTDNGLNCLDSKTGTFKSYTLKDGLFHSRITCIKEDRDGNLWVGTYNGGLNRLIRKTGTFERFSSPVGLRKTTIWNIYEDREGSLWIAAEGGLNRLKDNKFSAFGVKEGLPYGSVWDIHESRQGELWIGMEGSGLTRLKNDSATTYTTKEGLAADIVWTVYEDRQGSLWIGTDGGGLSRLKNGTFSTIDSSDGLSGDRISAIYEDRTGNLWIGTYAKGLNRMERNSQGFKITTYSVKEGLSHAVVTAIYEDDKGLLWVGTENGLNCLDPKSNEFTLFNETNGLSNNFITCFYNDNRQNLWIGTYGGGLNRLKNGRFTAVTNNEGLFNDVVYTILEDAHGNFWMSCNQGVFRASKKELNDVCSGKIARVHCESFNEKDGMKSRECKGTVQTPGCKTRDGKLWFPTSKGITSIDPNQINYNRLPPPVKVQQLLTGQRKILIPFSKAGPKIVLAPGSQRLEIRYTAFSFLLPERVYFKCKLEGVDETWRQMGTRRTAHYTQLPPGDYTFRVTACNNDGIWNEEGDSFSFHLQSYFHQTIWFYLAVGLGILLLGFGTYRLRIRQLTHNKMELERLVMKRTLQLEESNKQLEMLSIAASESHNAVTIMDAQGNLQWINEGCTRLYGYTIEQLINERGRNVVQISSHPGIPDLLSQFQAQPNPLRYESLYETREGKKIWTQNTWSPILDEAGHLTRIVSIGSDITRIKHSEDQIRQQNDAIRKQNQQILKQSGELKKTMRMVRKQREAADAANRAKSEFLARMSHELRTPMNGITGFTQMLLDTPLNPEQLDYTQTISRSNLALTTLLNDILDFSKMEAGVLKMTPHDFEPAATVVDVCGLMQPRLEQKPVKLLYNINDNVPVFVKGDEGRFRQVLVNLLGNAVKFTDEGQIEILLHIEKEEEKRLNIHVAVRDTGIGIDAKKLESVFREFHQEDGSDTRRYEGTGLGLTICRQIAKLMNGNIWAHSSQGKGSIFHFTAWMDKSIKEPKKKNSSSGGQFEGNIESGSLLPRSSGDDDHLVHILLAEDNSINRKLAYSLLSKSGYKMTAVNDGQEAVGTYTADPDRFQLILMDIQMPRLNGFEATKEIRQTEESRNLPPIPIIAMTAQSMKGDREKCLQAGMNDYISKPINKIAVLETVKKWTQRPVNPSSA